MLKRHCILWLVLLILYVLGGTPLVPFHGDESTIIWMSRDFGYILLDNDLERVRYRDLPVNETEQHLRLLNGTLTRYIIGASWAINGYQTADINEQWDWGADWNYNQNFGHMPDDFLLMLGRWPLVILFATSVVWVFWLGLQISGQPVAYLASGYFALSSALLINGRRAMFEGVHVAFSLLVMVLALQMLRQKSWWMTVLLGVSSGLAGSAKHSAVLTIVSVYGLAFLFEWFHEKPFAAKTLLRLTRRWLAALVIGVIVFLMLNPLWWGDPLVRFEQVIETRAELLDDQVAAFGDYDNFSDRLLGFWRQVFIAQPQFYEIDGWGDYIGKQIAVYEATIWDGITVGGNQLGALILLMLVTVGFLAIVIDSSKLSDARWLIGGWGVFLLVTLAIVTPIEWQRYFVMAYPVVGLFASTGLIWVLRLSVRRVMNPKGDAGQLAD